MTEKWEAFLDQGKSFGAFLTDLSKAFGSLHHDIHLEKLSKNLFQWFYMNQMKGNPDKWHLLLPTSEKRTRNVQGLNIINSKSKKLRGITIDSNLSFQSHSKNLCKKARSKIHVVVRGALYANIR